MRVVAIVQARLGSTRLPRKVLADIGGEPALTRLLRVLVGVLELDDIVLAVGQYDNELMTARPVNRDGRITVWGLNYPMEANVLGRYVAASSRWRADAVVRITGDCPLIDPREVAHIVQAYRKRPCDYLVFDQEVRGMQSVEMFSAEALRRLDAEMAADDPDREHCGVHRVVKGGYYVRTIPPAQQWTIEPPYRLCIDTAEDLELVRAVVAALGAKANDTAEVVHWLDQHPEVAQVNEGIEQRV